MSNIFADGIHDNNKQQWAETGSLVYPNFYLKR